MRRSNAPLLLAILVEAMGYGAIFGLLAHLQDTYGFPQWGLGLIASAAFPAALVGQLGLARYADRGYTRHLLWIGLATAAFGMLWFWRGNELWEFVLARAFVGLGSGTFIPAARRVLISRSPANAGAAVGMAGAADIGGFLIGIPVAAGLKAVTGSVNAPFLFICLALLAVGPIATILTEEPPITHEHDGEAIRSVLRLPAARAGLAIGVGFSVAIGTLDAIAARYILDLGASDAELVLVMIALAVPLVLFMPVAGRMVDHIGPLKAGSVALMVTVPVMIGYGLANRMAAHQLLAVAVLGVCQAVANSVVYTAGQASVANSTARAGLVGAGQGAYEATAAIGGFVCSLGAPLIYMEGNTLPMWTALAALVTGAALISRWWAREAEGQDLPPDPQPATAAAG